MMRDNCGIKALDKLELGMKRISAKSLCSIAQDNGLDLHFVRVKESDAKELKAPFILYFDNHFEVINSITDTTVGDSFYYILTSELGIGEPLDIDFSAEFIGEKGGSTSIEMPSAPAQPSTADAIRAWREELPNIYDIQMQYAPKEAQQQVDLANQYAGQYGLAMKQAQEALYPGTSAIQEKLANQALTGMDSQAPDWMQQQYLSNLRSNLGTNAGSPIAADYSSRGLMQMNKDWGDYYRNLGLTVSGRQPMAQAQTPGYSNYMSSFTPTNTMNFMGGNYGTSAGIYGTQMNAYQNQQGKQSNGFDWAGLGMQALGAVGTAFM